MLVTVGKIRKRKIGKCEMRNTEIVFLVIVFFCFVLCDCICCCIYPLRLFVSCDDERDKTVFLPHFSRASLNGCLRVIGNNSSLSLSSLSLVLD